MFKTKTEKDILGQAYSDLNLQLAIAGERLTTLHKMRNRGSWEAQKYFLEKRHPSIYSQLYGDADDGFTTVGRDPLDVWVNPREEWRDRYDEGQGQGGTSKKNFRELVILARQNVNALTLAERRDLLNHWLGQMAAEEVKELSVDIESVEKKRQQVDMIHRETNRRILRGADVIGITTTGLAKDAAMLRKLRSKVVVCEEAAEVLESHLISALMPGVEHFIQIGDHRQLRPQINNFSLSLESARGQPYQLDRSQFERLAVGQPGLPAVPVTQLSMQRRMRPDIARLIRNTVYPGLQDHGSVMHLPDVVGMRDNVFWLNHDKLEDGSTDDGRVKSHSNAWEVAMTKALVRHLVRQGAYKSKEIAVLTPYSGQLHKLRAALEADFDISVSDRDKEDLEADGFESQVAGANPSTGVLGKKRLLESLRLATVDNFQGEEADVIVISLVRSNTEGNVGFLRTDNRINVLLSRARHGMYLIGSADNYAHVPMWANVRQQLEEDGLVGPAFNLCCPRHRDTPIRCAEPDDFITRSPEGGCDLGCEWRLEKCGHWCLAKCHSEAMHSAFQCPLPCPRRRSTCNHPCLKLCGENCGLCRELVDSVHLPCGHEIDGIHCYRALEPAYIRCSTLVDKRVPDCGHVVTLPCARDVEKEGFACPARCKEVLDCGHLCPGSCGVCKSKSGKDAIHQKCNKECGRPRHTCSHICKSKYHSDEPCPPCTERWSNESEKNLGTTPVGDELRELSRSLDRLLAIYK